MSIALALSLLKRFWWSIPMLGLLIALGITRHSLASTRRDLAACNKHGAEVQAAYDQFAANVRAAQAKASADNKAHVAAVTRQQEQITSKVESDYAKRLAELRARYNAVRVRTGKAAADRGVAGSAGMPGVPEAACGVNGAACEDGLSPSDALAASEIALRLEALQEWIRSQRLLSAAAQ